MKYAMLLLIAVGFAQGQGVSAHHSATAIYDYKKTITVTGAVTKVRWSNPHVLFSVDVKGADNTVEAWEFELHSPNEMMRMGWTRAMFQLGTVITVEGTPARSGVKRAFTSQVTFPDGQKRST